MTFEPFHFGNSKNKNQFCHVVLLDLSFKNAMKYFIHTTGFKLMLFSMFTFCSLSTSTSITMEPLVCKKIFVAFFNRESKLGEMKLSQTSYFSGQHTCRGARGRA